MTNQQELLVEFDNWQREDQLFQLNLEPKLNSEVESLK